MTACAVSSCRLLEIGAIHRRDFAQDGSDVRVLRPELVEQDFGLNLDARRIDIVAHRAAVQHGTGNDVLHLIRIEIRVGVEEVLAVQNAVAARRPILRNAGGAGGPAEKSG